MVSGRFCILGYQYKRNMLRKYLLLFILIMNVASATSQELSAMVSIQSSKVENQVDPKTFVQLQTQLKDFLNQRKWSPDAFGNEEKIDCSFYITIESVLSPGVYEAKLSVVSNRPVYNSNYSIYQHKSNINYFSNKCLNSYINLYKNLFIYSSIN